METMKKFKLFLIGGVLMSMTFAACNSNNKLQVKVSLDEKGFEHVHTPIVIDWLNADGESEKELVLNDTPPDVWSLEIVSEEFVGDELKVEFSGVHSYNLEEGSFSLMVNEDGVSGDFVN